MMTVGSRRAEPRDKSCNTPTKRCKLYFGECSLFLPKTQHTVGGTVSSIMHHLWLLALNGKELPAEMTWEERMKHCNNLSGDRTHKHFQPTEVGNCIVWSPKPPNSFSMATSERRVLWGIS